MYYYNIPIPLKIYNKIYYEISLNLLSQAHQFIRLPNIFRKLSLIES